MGRERKGKVGKRGREKGGEKWRGRIVMAVGGGMDAPDNKHYVRLPNAILLVVHYSFCAITLLAE